MSRAIHVAVMLSFAWPLMSLQAQETSSGLFAGAAKADITPYEWPVPLVGSFNERLAYRAWDPLYARAIVLRSDDTTLGIVIVDNCLIKRDILDEAKRRIQDKVGIPSEALLIAATHTHTAPPGRHSKGDTSVVIYHEQMIKGIVSSVDQAFANLEPAEAGWGGIEFGHEVFNRRWYLKEGTMPENPFGSRDDQVRMNPPRGQGILVRPAGPTDPELSVLSIRSRDGRHIALLGNYSLHYVGGIPAGGVSADYFGAYAKQLENELQDSDRRWPPMVAMMSNGTSGDVNNINFTSPRPSAKPFERMQAVADQAADLTQQVVQSIEYTNDFKLGVEEMKLTVDRRRPTAEQIEKATGYLEIEDASKVPRLAHAYARRVLDLAEAPPTVEIVLQAIRIGDLGIAAIPCETFAEIGLEIKAKSPLSDTFTIELANGHYGYLPTPEQHALGGYETWLGTCELEENASVKITEVILDLLSRSMDN